MLGGLGAWHGSAGHSWEPNASGLAVRDPIKTLSGPKCGETPRASTVFKGLYR